MYFSLSLSLHFPKSICSIIIEEFVSITSRCGTVCITASSTRSRHPLLEDDLWPACCFFYYYYYYSFFSLIHSDDWNHHRINNGLADQCEWEKKNLSYYLYYISNIYIYINSQKFSTPKTVSFVIRFVYFCPLCYFFHFITIYKCSSNDWLFNIFVIFFFTTMTIYLLIYCCIIQCMAFFFAIKFCTN